MRILIATGGSPHSDVAVRLGGAIAEAIGASVTVLTVVKNEAGRAKAEGIVDRAATLLPAGVQAQKAIAVGQQAQQIVRLVRETDQELLVLGERVHHGLAKRILAPTVQRVLEQMPCPVLIARGQVRPPKRILLCEAGREPSLLHRLMDRLMPLLKVADTVTVLHVMSQMAAGPGIKGWELQADAQKLMEGDTPEGKLLEADLKRMEALQIHLEAKVRHGLVVKEILAEARSGDYDLVVIGAHLGSRWERFLLDDLAQEIVDHADRPVLVV
jgi:nucleotide-binding universal stress UspA family protein